MNAFYRFPLFLAGAALALMPCSVAFGQAEDLGTLVSNSLTAMKQENWHAALELNTEAIARFGKNMPLQIYGPRFGNIYYRKGICEMKLKRWQEAMKSFEAAYKDFPNAARAGGGNQFEKMALLRWGEAAMGAEDWEVALLQFEKFLKERDKTRDHYQQGTFHLGLAICNYKLGKIAEGNENLEAAISNKDSFRTPQTGIIAAFQALVEAVIDKHEEQVLMDFIAKHRGTLTLASFTMQEYSPVFMELAAQAIGADMQRTAMALYQFVPSTEVAIHDLRAKIAAMGKLRGVKDGPNTLVKAKMEEELKALESSSRSMRTNEMMKLAATAFVHEKYGNIRGAFTAYEQLEKNHPDSQKREDNLFNLVRTSALVASGPVTQRYAAEFLTSFPNSKYVPEIRKMMLSALFYDGKYETCIEVAEPMLPNLKPDTIEHDICLHVLGGSFFYTGQYDKAQPLLDEHVAKYPKSAFVIASTYFQASNLSALQFWSKAGSLLDAFLAKYPDPSINLFLPAALCDRATCHYAEEQYDDALKHLERIISEFSDSNVIDMAWNLRGNVEQSLGNREEAEKSYLAALEIAERRNNDGIASESLFSLVALLGDKEKNAARLKDAVVYADKFWKEYAEISPYKSQVAVAQVAALNEAGRGDEALEQLRRVVSEAAKDPDARGLEELINSYTEAYLEKHSPEELKEHYYNFPDIRSSDRAAWALLRVALIGVFEGVIKKSEDEGRKRSAEAMISVLFRELKSDFDVKDLTNFILVRVGDYLRANTTNPRAALPYYDEVIGRQDQSYLFNALLGRADVYCNSQDTAELDQAAEDLDRVFADSQEKSQREFSLFRMVELFMIRKDYAKAAEKARIYLDREKTGFSKYSPQVGFLLAESFDKRGMVDDALATYVKVWSSHMGNISISAPAMVRWMELSWGRNKESDAPNMPDDRQLAYESGARFIELTERFKDKLTEDDLEKWTKVKELLMTYEANPEIKPMEQVKKEEAERRRR